MPHVRKCYTCGTINDVNSRNCTAERCGAYLGDQPIVDLTEDAVSAVERHSAPLANRHNTHGSKSTSGVRYDPVIVQSFADRLYATAMMLVATYTGAGVIIGLLGMLLEPLIGLIAAVVLGIGGYLLGSSKAFAFKLQAQTALCQVEIEKNTREPAAVVGSQT